jgi:hypothetical protein
MGGQSREMGKRRYRGLLKRKYSITPNIFSAPQRWHRSPATDPGAAISRVSAPCVMGHNGTTSSPARPSSGPIPAWKAHGAGIKGPRACLGIVRFMQLGVTIALAYGIGL